MSNNSQLPTPESYEQLVGDMLSTYIQKTGVNDLNVGSLITSIFETVGLAVARSSGNVFQIQRDLSEDRATGQALQNIAFTYGIIPTGASASTGKVNISDTAFTKISTKVYAGTAAPNAGATVINVSDASQIAAYYAANPTTTAVYIGRGTPNIEGPILIVPVGGVVQVGSYWQLTFTTGLVNFHNINESVIVAQGGLRTIALGTTVTAPTTGASPSVSFTTGQIAYILDGETEVDNVPVTCTQTGTVGNVPIGSINQITASFPTAAVTNIVPFTNGQDTETDAQLALAIKKAKASVGLGTATVVENSVIGAQPSDEAVTCTSSNLIINQAGSTVLYVDDGTGYEETTAGVGIEVLITSAIGGETNFQLQTGGDQTSVAKAFVQSNLQAPFDVVGTDRIAFNVGGITTEHVFASSDFASLGGATAYEIADSVNADTLLNFQCTTAGGGTYVVFSAKANTDDSIQSVGVTTGRNAAIALELPLQRVDTLRLFLNGLPLSEWGQTATITTVEQSLWGTITNGATLTISVDHTGANPVFGYLFNFTTYTFVDQDFINEGTYPNVSQTNSLQSWVNVINAKITGITAAVVGTQIQITSNLGALNRASLVIDSATSSMVSNNMFSSILGLVSNGVTSNYVLDRNTAQLELAVPLVARDLLTAGTANTEAFIDSSILGTAITIIGSPAYFWGLADDDRAQIINTGVASGTQLTISQGAPNFLIFQSSVSGAFSNIDIVTDNAPSNYVIIWSPEVLALTADINNASSLEARVWAVTTTTFPNDTLTLQVTNEEYLAFPAFSVVNFNKGFVVVRTTKTPQKYVVPPVGTTLPYTASIYTVAQDLSAQGNEIVFTVQNNNKLVATTKTLNSNGAVMIVTANGFAGPLGWNLGVLETSTQSLLGYYESGYSEASFPTFFHSTMTQEQIVDPPNSFMQFIRSTLNASVYDPNKALTLLQPYGEVLDALNPNETSFVNQYVGLDLIFIANAWNAPEYEYYRRVRSDANVQDRFFLSEPLTFTPFDTMSVVVDNNINGELYTMNMYRTATTYLPIVSTSSFNAYDTDGGPTTPFTQFFPNFDFTNFAVLMQAKNVLMPLAQGSQSALLFRSVQWGRSGEYINVGYVYPSLPNFKYSNNVVAHTVLIGEEVTIRIILQSGALVGTTIDATTQWNVAITAPNFYPGVDLVTYTYSGTGTAPGLGSLVGGEYVNISAATGFSSINQGVYRVSDIGGHLPTATSFTILQPHSASSAYNQTNVTTLSPTGIVFYQEFATTASDIAGYVNSSLSLGQIITATILNDGGTTGSGVVSTSTWETTYSSTNVVTYFGFEGVQLQDGINWIANVTAAIPPTPWPMLPFYLINLLQLPYFGSPGYVYNFANGETLKLAPTSLEQVSRFISVPAVTGLSSVASVTLSSADTKLQIATNTVGSGGSIQIVGGAANDHQAPVLNDASLVYYSTFQAYGTIPISSANIPGFISDAWIKITATHDQSKVSNIDGNTLAEVDNYTYTDALTSITTAVSRITLSNDAPLTNISNLYFGNPRNFVRTQNRTFKVEQQGKFICISWDGVGTSPFFAASQPINWTTGDTVNVLKISSTDIQFTIVGGTTTFVEANLGDTLTVANMDPANNGTFNITGISPDGTTVQVYNPNGVNQLDSATFTLNPTLDITAGDTFTVDTTTLTAGTDFAIVAGNVTLTANNLAQKISAVVPGATATSLVNVVTVMATTVNSALAISCVSTHAVASSANLQPVVVLVNTFDLEAQVSEGDNVTIRAPFALDNQGKFRVIRTFNDSIYIDNPIGIEETVPVFMVPGTNEIDIGDATTTYNVVESNNKMRLEWTGTGTRPVLESLLPGDEVTFGAPFNIANQGNFQVRSVHSDQQITVFTFPLIGYAGGVSAGSYYTFHTAGDVNYYQVWQQYSGTNVAPATLPGATLIEVNIQGLTSASLIAQANAVAILAATLGSMIVTTSGAELNLSTTDYLPTTVSSAGTMPGGFTVTTDQSGAYPYVVINNPSSVNDPGVAPAAALQFMRPALLFRQYDCTDVGDVFTVTSSVFGATSPGKYSVLEVLGYGQILVTRMPSQTIPAVILTSDFNNVTVVEQYPYVGYKKIYYDLVNPNNTSQGIILTTTSDQFVKINSQAACQVVAEGKLSFSTVINKGLDGYRYDTGLIGECNRIVYGDPRDPVTYPGVSAAGVDIFIQPPLVRRVTLAINVRLNTGVPFNIVQTQVQQNVSALVNSNDIGQSIAISAIVAVVNAIPGVTAVSISSPLYSPINDLIKVNPQEKTLVLSPQTDILVSLTT